MRLTFFFVFSLAACSDPEKAYLKADAALAKGETATALKLYRKVLDSGSKQEGAAALKIGRLIQKKDGDCRAATKYFERAARFGGRTAAPAKISLLTCPDYFPSPLQGKWVYVDTLSGGENMRLEMAVVKASAPLSAVFAGTFFAGEQKFREMKRELLREDWGIWEERDSGRLPILRYPFEKGRSWTGEENGLPVTFEIVSDAETVEVKAGRFEGCLKVRSQTQGFESWVFDYYCPGVGRVKTTVGVADAENPNTELAEFRVPKL